MIFRLCDEDEDLDLAAEPVHPAAEGSHHGRSREFGFRHGEQPSWDPSQEPRTVTWADREPWTAEPPEGPSPVYAGEAWEVDPDTTASSGMFDWDGLEPDGRDRPIDGDERPGWTGREPARALRTAASSRSWFSDRVLALGAIAIVALLVVAISHSARPAGRGSVGQRPLEAAAVGVSTEAPLPASAASPRSGRRPPPQPPAAPPAKPRRARRHQSTPPRPLPAKAPARTTPAPTPAVTPASIATRVPPAEPAAPLPAPAPAPAPGPGPLRTDRTSRREAPPASTLAEFSFER